MGMTQKENFYAMIKGEKPEFAPIFNDMQHVCLLETNNADQPWQGGTDPFGVKWVATREGVIPKPGDFMFDDIADWEKFVKFPDINSLGFEQMAQIDLQNVDRNKVVSDFSVCGIFERMAAFMGFENTLISLIEEPEACKRFADAFSDYKVATILKMINLTDPDMVIVFDDIATARGTFMSPSCWREIFKPYTKKIVDAVKSRGVVYAQHTCGKCEDVIEDYVDIGVQWWNSAQSMNDLTGIMKKYGNKLIVEGGWDSSGAASYLSASDEDIIKETKRCLKEYACYDNFSMFPIVFGETGTAQDLNPAVELIIETWRKGCYHDLTKNSISF